MMKSNFLKSLAAITALFALWSASVVAQSKAEKERFAELVELFGSATIVGVPSIEDCILSEKAEAKCLKITTVAQPSNHVTGPYCPLNINDSADEGGIWFVDGEMRNVDGDFIANLATTYGDDHWQMFDPETGDIYRRANEIGCIVAGDPTNETQQPDNICVECAVGFIGRTITQTHYIPLTSNVSSRSNGRIGPDTGVGVAFNGVKMDAPAPLHLIIGGYTLGPLDDCGGHVNPHTGYHYHGVIDGCGPETKPNDASHAAKIGVAMDGHDIYSRLNANATEPNDLDACRGHETEGFGYHYHANPAADNQIIGCFKSQTGCSLGDSSSACDASVSQRRPRPE